MHDKSRELNEMWQTLNIPNQRDDIGDMPPQILTTTLR